MSRIQGHILAQSDFPCEIGRLVANYDSGAQTIEFLVPSNSRSDRVYGVEVDVATAEIACKCEAFEFRHARNSPYRLEVAGSPAEVLARARAKRLLPLVTRAPRGLCPHARRVRAWLMRHGLMQVMISRESWLIERLSGERGAA